jgi:hypothetical protein
MKWLAAIAFMLILAPTKVQEQSYSGQVRLFDTKKAGPLGPFTGFKSQKFYLVVVRDTTIFIAATTKKDTAKHRDFFYQAFRILNRSKDSLRFLVLSQEYFSPINQQLNMLTGFDYMYTIDLRNKQFCVKIYGMFNNSMNRKHIDIDFDKPTRDILLIKGQ